MKKNLHTRIGRFFIILLLAGQISFAQEFTWIKGSNITGQSGAYGTAAVPSLSNTPGAREVPARWTDAAGNLWLFGGYGFDGIGNQFLLSDLWKYSPSTNIWTFMKGDMTVNQPDVYGTIGVSSAANKPGAREGAVSWTDTSGNLWLFGGISPYGEMNDLWKYNITTNEWTWMNGSNAPLSMADYGTAGVAAASNVPGSRAFSSSWTDGAGNLWLFGGAGNDAAFVFGSLNDVWKYNISSNQWVWVRGSNTSSQNGIYGTLGTMSVTNDPGTRYLCNSWQDANGNTWLFGGIGMDATNTTDDMLNDLWKYNAANNEWTWMGGANANNQPGQYGTLGVSAASNIPGARLGSATWADALGNFYLFGGYGYDAVSTNDNMNDLWKYSTTNNQWTWIKGSNTGAQSGVYGMLGQPSSNGIPGARSTMGSWADASGRFWLFGGAGFDSDANSDDLNDLWVYGTCVSGPTLNVVSSATTICTGSSATLTASGATTYSWLSNQSGSVIAVSPPSTTDFTVVGTDAYGCRDTASITQLVSVCTTIREGDNALAQLVIYPNPNRGTFSVQKINAEGEVKFLIFNALGQKVAEETLLSGETTIRLVLPAGIYSYNVLRDDRRIGMGKLILE